MQLMKPIAIHQFSITSHFGDGITNGMLFTRKLLRAAGIASDIFSVEIDPALAAEIASADTYSGSPDNVLLIHHGIGNGSENWLKSLPDRKVMVFHNITPSRFFAADHPIQPLLTQGWQQLDTWRDWLDGAIADSDTNLDILTEYGYDSTRCRTIPLLVDLDSICTFPPAPSPRPIDDIFHLLFVGRLVPHKNQRELVQVLAHVRQMTGLNVHLTLIGGGENSYREFIEKGAHDLGLASVVHLTGKVTDAELADYFRKSDLYVSLSQHEGFGVPLIEAMAHCLPVVAFDTPGSNVAKTLGGAGIILDDDNPIAVASVIASTIEQPLLRRELVKKGLLEVQRFTVGKLYDQLSLFFNSIGIEIPEKNFEDCSNKVSDYRIEGPFDSSYSLAIVNSNLALSLAKSGASVALHATEGPGDYLPNHDFLAKNPSLQGLYSNSDAFTGSRTILRLMYPCRMTGMNGVNHGLSCYGWEESSMPRSTIDHINCHAHFVTTMSEYVSKTLIDNGANVPIYTTGIGADHILEHLPDARDLPELGSGFRILHISSCFPRKGIAPLLEAYAQQFDSNDDVTLIVKTFPNPHHDMASMISEWRKRHPRGARIQLINRDLAAGAIRALYQQCQVLVAPSRGEGFGLPMAEAMLHRLPVITTAYGGQRDFCNEQNAWLVDYTFEFADTHMAMPDSVWADPDVKHLGEIVLRLYHTFNSGDWERSTRDKVTKAFDLVSTQYSWEALSSRFLQALDHLDQQPVAKARPKLGCITTWNTKCGIATYSKLLLEPALNECLIFANSNVNLIGNDGVNVARCWLSGQADDLKPLYNAILATKIDQVLIQFNFAFFELGAFKNLLALLASSGIDIFITFHSTADVNEGNHSKSLALLLPELQHAARLFVHSVSDLNNLKRFGLAANTTLFPHGVKTDIVPTARENELAQLQGKTIISTYGFLLPHKGTRNLIEAFYGVAMAYPDTHLLLVNAIYPAEVSSQEAQSCHQLIKDLSLGDRVTLLTDFLEDAESLAWLNLSSFIVFPYEYTQESSSAAVRWGLATGKPVYCTPLQIFDDVRDVVGFFSGTAVGDIEAGLTSVLSGRVSDPQETFFKQQQWLQNHDWRRLSSRLGNLMHSYSLNKPI